MRESVSKAELSVAYTSGIDEHASLFGGGYTNYGYWKGISPTGKFSIQDRIKSQEALYRLALDRLDISAGDRILEVGCGRGRGAAFALNEYSPAEMHGVDLLPTQIQRSRNENAEALAASEGRLIFRSGSAADLPYPEGYFDKFISIEAAQHFPSLDGFAREIARVARRPARVAVATVFAPSSDIDVSQWLEFVSFMSGLTYAHPITELAGSLTKAGFTDVVASRIGDQVWPGLDAWIDQTEFKNTEHRNWFVAYKRRLLDYFLVTAELTASHPS